MSAEAGPLRPGNGASLLLIRLTPKGGRDALEPAVALSDGRFALRARVRAAPEDGRANAALIALLAEMLEIPRQAVTLEGGATSRLKTLRIGKDYTEVESRLRSLALLPSASSSEC